MLCSISAFAQKRITFKIEKLSTPENFLYLQSYDDIYKRLIMSETEVFSKEVEKQEKNPPFNIIAKAKLPTAWYLIATILSFKVCIRLMRTTDRLCYLRT